MSNQVRIQPSSHVYQVAEGDTILSAAIDAGFNLPYGCRNGACGACKGKVLEGFVDHGDYQPSALTEDEIDAGLDTNISKKIYNYIKYLYQLYLYINI